MYLDIYKEMPCSMCVNSPPSTHPLHPFSKFIIIPFHHMPQCNHRVCAFFSKVAFNVSKHETQRYFRHANHQHIGARNLSAAPIVQPCEATAGFFPSSEGIYSVPCGSFTSPRSTLFEDSITFEDHDTRGRSSSEVLVDTIILSLN